jgi:hypothetical protein
MPRLVTEEYGKLPPFPGVVDDLAELGDDALNRFFGITE